MTPGPGGWDLKGAADGNERYRSIVETAVDAIITIDEAGRIESVNPATEALFGYSAGELLGSSVNMLMDGPDAAAHDGHMARYGGGGEAHIIGIGREVLARRKDGSTFPVHLAVGEMTEGGRRMFTGMMRDLSDLLGIAARTIYRKLEREQDKDPDGR